MIYNDYGHQVYKELDLIDLLITGDNIDGCVCELSDNITQFIKSNEDVCAPTTISIYTQPSTSPFDYHQPYVLDYQIPDEYKTFDLVKYIFDKVEEKSKSFSYDIEIAYTRIEQELELFYAHDLENYVRSIVFIIDSLSKNNIIHGCGRGSSVASFILFLIGVHYVDPIKYDINISEFLRK
jgi:DNA polymerase III alpha subunit